MDEKPLFKLPPELIGTVFKGELDIPVVKRRQIVSLEGKVGSRVDPTKYRGNGHWQFPTDMGSNEFIGFIYVIVDLNTWRMYLGKKNFRTLKKVEGTVRRQSTDMNWRWYISSSVELSAAIKNYGKEGFKFICIEQYKTKGMLSYAETWSLMHVESPSNEALWYNRLINKVAWYVKERISDEHRKRLKRVTDIVHFRKAELLDNFDGN